MNKRTAYLLLHLLVLTLSLQLTSCESKAEEFNGNNNFSDPALTFKVISCERIGRSLVLEFEVKNNTKQVMHNVELTENGSNEVGQVSPGFCMWPTDNTGEYYPGNYVNIGKVMHKENYIIKELGATPVTGHIVVPLFDTNGKATTVSIDKLVTCDDYKFHGFLDRGILRFDNIPFADNRGAIWSPDRTLQFEAGDWHATNNGNNDIIIRFTVSNTCDEPLRHLTLWVNEGDSDVPYGLTDSNGKSFFGIIWSHRVSIENGQVVEKDEEICRCSMRVVGEEWNTSVNDISIGPWESVDCEVLVCEYDGSDRLSMAIGCNTDDRLLADPFAHLFDWPVHR